MHWVREGTRMLNKIDRWASTVRVTLLKGWSEKKWGREATRCVCLSVETVWNALTISRISDRYSNEKKRSRLSPWSFLKKRVISWCPFFRSAADLGFVFPLHATTANVKRPHRVYMGVRVNNFDFSDGRANVGTVLVFRSRKELAI